MIQRHMPLSIAPMMDWTDRHYRFFMRQLTQRTLLYTEMVTTWAILHGNKNYLLGYSDVEHPLVLQLGGDDPKDLAACARIAEDYGYDQLNLNVGCPSSRVQHGSFGACLMAEPERVADAVAAMMAAVKLPVTVKQRIGIDDLDRYEDMANFVAVVSQTGCKHFIVHARKAWLSGLSPKENRTIPPLRYDDVYRLKREFPRLKVEINGGIRDFEQSETHLKHVDAVMIGRAAYEHPYMFASADQRFYGATHPGPSRREVIEGMVPYIAKCQQQGIYPKHITRHMLGLFAAKPGAKAWKRHLSEQAHRADATAEILFDAVNNISEDVLNERPRHQSLVS